MSDPTIRVAIGDAQPLFRAALARLVLQDPGLQLVAELESGRSALAAIRRQRPDVAVLGADEPCFDPRRLLAAVAREQPRTPIVLLAGEVRGERAFAAMAAGARGFLSKRCGDDELRTAIRRVAAGGAAFCPDAQALMASEVELRHRDAAALLTARERDVLTLIAQGLSSPAIGRRLHLAPATVKGYQARIYERLGVCERAHAVAEAMRRGVLD